MSFLGTQHLKDGHEPSVAVSIKKTYPGMAHFAGTGPERAFCRTCVFWKSATGSHEYGSGTFPTLRDHPCQKFRQLSGKVTNCRVPSHAEACRHYQASPNPPPIQKPVK